MHNHNFFGIGFLWNELTQHDPVLALFECRHVADMILQGGDYFVRHVDGRSGCSRGNRGFDGGQDAAMIKDGPVRIVDRGREVFVRQAH